MEDTSTDSIPATNFIKEQFWEDWKIVQKNEIEKESVMLAACFQLWF